MFLLVCQGFLLPQNQEIELGKCESFLVTSLPERKREPLFTENVLENICLGSGSPRPFCFVRPQNMGWRLAQDRNCPRLLSRVKQLKRTARAAAWILELNVFSPSFYQQEPEFLSVLKPWPCGCISRSVISDSLLSHQQ